MTQEQVATWILDSPNDVLERKIRSFPESDHPTLLTWALKVQKDPSGNSAAGIKWAVAIIGTLAPEMFTDNDDNILDTELVDY